MPWASVATPAGDRAAAVVVALLGTSLTVARCRLLPIRWRKRLDESDLASVAAAGPAEENARPLLAAAI